VFLDSFSINIICLISKSLQTLQRFAGAILSSYLCVKLGVAGAASLELAGSGNLWPGENNVLPCFRLEGIAWINAGGIGLMAVRYGMTLMIWQRIMRRSRGIYKCSGTPSRCPNLLSAITICVWMCEVRSGWVKSYRCWLLELFRR